MGAHVFISHSSRDRDVALALCTALEERGVACWLASRDIGPGQNFQEAIVRAVQEANVMLLVFTSNANNSDEIKKELALASQNRVMVIPVRTEDVLPSDAFRYELATRQWVDVFQDWDRAVGKLADHVRAAAGETKPPVPPTAPARKAAAPLPKWALAVAALVVVLAIGGVSFWLLGRASSAASLTGVWVSDEIANVYAPSEKSKLEVEFQQTGETLSGRVKEIVKDRGAATTGIHEGHVAGGQVTFYTVGETTAGDETRGYHENYQGTLQDKRIIFTRANDAPSGGEAEHFTLRRK